MLNPAEWSDIATKLGVPFVMFLMFFIVCVLVLKWILKPFADSYINVLRGIEKATRHTANQQNELLSNQRNQCRKLDKICDSIDNQTTQLKEVIQPNGSGSINVPVTPPIAPSA